MSKLNKVEELKTKLFKTSRPKSALMINEACEKNFFFLEKSLNVFLQTQIKTDLCANCLAYFNCLSL